MRSPTLAEHRAHTLLYTWQGHPHGGPQDVDGADQEDPTKQSSDREVGFPECEIPGESRITYKTDLVTITLEVEKEVTETLISSTM